MDRDYGDAHYSSHWVEDSIDGCGGYELVRVRAGASSIVARVLFWDASGQYFVETVGTDVPLAIIELLIAETKTKLKVPHIPLVE